MPCLKKIDLPNRGTAENGIRLRSSLQIDWPMTMVASRPLQFLNKLSAAVPLWPWKSALFRNIQEDMAKRFLGMGELKFSFVTPSTQNAITVPREIYWINSSKAEFNNKDLGKPVKRDQNPMIGNVPLPIRPVFMVGEAHAKIKDSEEYTKTRQEVK